MKVVAAKEALIQAVLDAGAATDREGATRSVDVACDAIVLAGEVIRSAGEPGTGARTMSDFAFAILGHVVSRSMGAEPAALAKRFADIMIAHSCTPDQGQSS